MAGLAVLVAGMVSIGFLDNQSATTEVALRMARVGVGIGLFQAAAYSLMMASVPPQRFGTAAAALSLAQASGAVLSVAVIGGIFAVSNGYHLGGLAGTGLTPGEMEQRAFVLAFRDVFWLGAAIAIVAGGTFWLSRRSAA